jgi:hypothetical protein
VENVLEKRCKVPTASPASSSMWSFAGLSCGRYCHELSTAVGRLSPVLTIYRPLVDCASVVFCRYFPSIYLPRSMRAILCEFFPDGLYCWVKCASACILPARTISMHVARNYIYPYRWVCGSCSQRRTPRRGRSRQQRSPTPSLRIPNAADDRHPVGGPSHRLGHLTFTPPAIIIVVANVSFWSRLTGGPGGTVGHNPTIGVT